MVRIKVTSSLRPWRLYLSWVSQQCVSCSVHGTVRRPVNEGDTPDNIAEKLVVSPFYETPRAIGSRFIIKNCPLPLPEPLDRQFYALLWSGVVRVYVSICPSLLPSLPLSSTCSLYLKQNPCIIALLRHKTPRHSATRPPPISYVALLSALTIQTDNCISEDTRNQPLNSLPKKVCIKASLVNAFFQPVYGRNVAYISLANICITWNFCFIFTCEVTNGTMN